MSLKYPDRGDPKGDPPQGAQEQVDNDHSDAGRRARTQRQHQQEQVAVTQPRLGAAGLGCRSAGLFYRTVLRYLGDRYRSVSLSSMRRLRL